MGLGDASVITIGCGRDKAGSSSVPSGPSCYYFKVPEAHTGKEHGPIPGRGFGDRLRHQGHLGSDERPEESGQIPTHGDTDLFTSLLFC